MVVKRRGCGEEAGFFLLLLLNQLKIFCGLAGEAVAARVLMGKSKDHDNSTITLDKQWDLREKTVDIHKRTMRKLWENSR